MEKKLDYYSERFMRMWGLSLSLKKFEEELGNVTSRREVVFKTSYFYHNKREKVNKYKYPRLNDELKKYEKSLLTKDMNDAYYKQYRVLLRLANKKEANAKTHKAYREYFLKEMKDRGMSLNFFANKYGVKYSNLYNYLNKNQNTLSLMTANRLKGKLNED